MATGFCYSKTGIYVLSACVVRDLYLHGLPTGYASWAEAGLHDSGIPYRHPSPIDSSISLASGRLVEEGIERVLLDHGNSGICDLLRRCGFIQLLGIQVGRYFILLPPIACRCDGECSVGNVLYPIIGIRGICARYLCLVHLHPPVAPVKPSFPPTGLEQLGSTFAILLAGGILFIPIRGGVTTSTANVGMVYFSQNQFLNHSAINPCFSLIASLSKQQDFASQFDFYPEEKRKALFDTLIQAQDSLCPGDSIPTEPVKLLTTTRPNILIIIMESFTANAIEAVGGEPGITPNLNRLSKEGVLFTNLYANSFRTDRGLVSVLNGYLAQPTTSIMKYPVKSQTLPSIAKSLNKEGYTADMLYGGDINFTNMQSYFYSSGYSKITADRDFPLSSRLSKWGANDDITFSHLYEDIKQRPVDGKPWLSTFLTLSSHEPFEVPFHHLEHPYLNSVAFTDSCIGNFIDTFKELPAWKNTVVIFVSDHGYRYPENMQEYGPLRFHIPMLWLGGAIAEPKVIDTYANQTDLAATLLNQMGLPTDEFSFSKDILNPCVPHYAFYTFNNGFGFIDESGVSVYDNEGNKILVEEPESGNETRLEKGKVLLQTLYDDLGNR